jgi:DHA1 family multidrug resistance protein-like MFS transporter
MILQRVQSYLSVPWKRTLMIMFFAQMVVAVGFSSIFPFLPLYVESLGTSTNLSIELLAGLVYSAQAFTMMLASPVWGTLADRYGRKLMVERSMFGGAVLLLMMAFVTTAEQLVFLRAIQGLITGTVAAANALIAAEAPRERTGFAMGLLQVGLGAGIALGPVIGGAIADAFGYHAAFFVTAALLFVAGVLVWLGVKEHFVPTESSAGKRKSVIGEWRHILSGSSVVITYSLRFVSTLGRMMLTPIAPLFVAALLLDGKLVNTYTGLVVGVAAATTTISSVYLGRLGDRIGHRRIFVTCAMIAALLYLPMSMVMAAWQLVVLQALVGIALGGIVPAISALLAKYTQPGEEGSVYGLDNSINAGARAIAPLIGAAIAMWFSLRATFVATAVLFLLAGLFAAWFLPRPKTN